jgi:hypothetical protein
MGRLGPNALHFFVGGRLLNRIVRRSAPETVMHSLVSPVREADWPERSRSKVVGSVTRLRNEPGSSEKIGIGTDYFTIGEFDSWRLI